MTHRQLKGLVEAAIISCVIVMILFTVGIAAMLLIELIGPPAV